MDLPSFIPIVSLYNEASWVWSELNVDATFVKLEEVLEVSPSNLRKFLNFKDLLLLSSTVPDELVDVAEPPFLKRIIKLLNTHGFDSWMIMDDYTYLDDPYKVSWSKLFRMFRRASYMLKRAGGRPIGLIKGLIQLKLNGASVKTYI